MQTDLSHFHQVFFEEAGEHLATMESLLLALDVAAPDADDLNAIFRAAHSIKGGAGTFGFGDLTEVTHVLESLLDRLRNRELGPTSEMIDVFLKAGDVLSAQLAGHRDAAHVDPSAAEAIIRRLRELASTTQTTAADAAPASEAISAAAGRFSITYTPNATGVGTSGETATNLLAELAGLGEATLLTEEFEPGRFRYVFTVATGADEARIREIFDFVALPEELHLEHGGAAGIEACAAAAADDDGFGFFDDAPGCPAEPDPGYGFFTALPVVEDPDPGYGFFEPLPQPPAEIAQSAPAPAPEPRKPTVKAADKAAADSSIRVSVEKVDHMINLVGELVITQAMLAQTVGGLAPEIAERLFNGMAQLERNTRDLQDTVMSIRMMPMSFVFSRYPRVVRDLANQLGKDVALVTEGEATELDKGLIEKIVDPLTHLVRNSLDHGIELPERRIAAGKSPRGTVTLRAAHQGGNIVIEVQDDGAGLRREKLLAKARERGMAVPDAMSDQDVWMLIFAPGFSTAETVTDVSGRGVGMDVVKRNIDALNGRVEIASAPGIGTKVTIRLPLTLAILDGMSVGVGSEVFIVPLTYIVESFQPVGSDIRTISGTGQVVHVRGEYLPLVPLYQSFNLEPETRDPTRGIVVIVESASGRLALFVDRLLGQHQVVIKSMETNYRKVLGFAGATIMGDGRVALILDIAALAPRP
ncbi:MAG TPA: chemotaxis protein CheW [Aromatoleum sp.]|uniref:chemotaxis protein CheW n=1 Tax=Aromatoleum sp. TaxID=2307007 RepID=UPI002B48B6D7|nr:chemotaxis protein CheW [Aromatoleum sp.]HJV28099.1 chemotaxis protein CheW [Aromatoleum sp.]